MSADGKAKGMKLLVVGGVAGGASAAARARRLDENAEIVMFERGDYISFANCGLPYHVGEVIPERDSLMVMTPEMFKARTDIDVRVRQEVTAINRDRNTVTVNRLDSGQTYEESYDRLILATGSSPVRPRIPGADDPNVFQLWTIPDMDGILATIGEGAKRAVVVGAGFIGLEIAENLRERGLAVDVVEMLPQVLPTLDAEMAKPLATELLSLGIGLHLNSEVTAISRADDGDSVLSVSLNDGSTLPADLVVLSVGVTPNSSLASEAGLPLSERRGIVVDEHLQTDDPAIFAVGDVIAVRDLVTGKPTMIPLAGPANRQGRIAADNICGRDSTYKGSIGTSVVKIGCLTAASSGPSERRLQTEGIEYRKVYLHPASNASYYPGGAPISMKLLFAEDGRVLGIQAVGNKGVDKRVDVVATAIRAEMTVFDLEELELAYAPPYGSAKDPVNFAGMLAANWLRGDTDVVHTDEIKDGDLLLDVREPAEVTLGMLEGAVHIPLGELRSRLSELPRERRIVVYCKVGLRGYLGERILKQHGFQAANLSGGCLTWQHFQPLDSTPVTIPCGAECGASPAQMDTPANADREIDVSALQCPGPVVRITQEMAAMDSGQVLGVVATKVFEPDLRSWCQTTGNQLLSVSPGSVNTLITALIKKAGSAGGEMIMSAACGSVSASPSHSDEATIVVFSNDLDKVMASFIIATGLATMGVKVSMFFTFWGLSVLRKAQAPSVAKDLLSKMFGFMLPKGARKLALSKMHMMGMGTAMMKHVMNKKNVADLPTLIKEARSLGVRFIACDMAMDVMGMKKEELLEDVDEVAGVASFASLTKRSGTALFI